MRLSSWILFFPFSQLLFPIAIALACVAFRVDRRKNVLAHPGWTERGEGNTSFMSLANLLYVQSIVLPLIAVCSYSPTRAGPVIAACPPARERGHPMISGAACGSLLSLLSPPSPPLSLNLVVETRGSVTPLFRHRARPDIVLCEIHRITPQ